MSFLKALLGIKKINSTLFYKEFSEDNKQLRELEELSMRVKTREKKAFIDRDIKLLKLGLEGEKNVAYELKSSKIPMICLHNIRLEDGDDVAQLDFVVITHRFIMVLETKRLNGDIYINEAGEFIRYIKNKQGKVLKKEGMYSPIAQNDRHVRILREILIKNGIIKTFSTISKVIIANPKSIINSSKVPSKIKKEILKYDQITEMINTEIKNHEKSGEAFESLMDNVAVFLMKNNREVDIDYYNKYSLTEEDFQKEAILEEVAVDEKSIENRKEENIIAQDNISSIGYKAEVNNAESNNTLAKFIVSKDSKCNVEDTKDISTILCNKLKEYRTNMARMENNKPYFIYNNNTLDEIVATKPKTKEELLKVKGFGPVKVEKYGEGILNIISEIV